MKISDGRTPKRFIGNEKNWSGVGDANKRTLLDFDAEKAAQGATEGTRYMYLFCIVKLAKHFRGKPFKQLDKKNLIRFFNEWSDYKSPSLKVSIKAFYKWLHCRQNYPECVAWIKTHGFEKRKLPEEILTAEEILLLTKATRTPRDRARSNSHRTSLFRKLFRGFYFVIVFLSILRAVINTGIHALAKVKVLFHVEHRQFPVQYQEE